MDTVNQNQEQQNLRTQLAVAVRSIQWSYSIFWSISASEPRVLEWSEGYYNGDIKTRKTMEGVEWNVDEMSLKRSEQLRDLYESLLVAETNPQSRRPSAALIPEDLSHTEWYYLVCMSFVFNLGQGLPGRAFGNGKPMWLCNAHQTDSRVFSRSLLAKSASIQTVMCFPILGGVVELGTTDLVLEDYSLIQIVEASLLGTDCPALPQIPISSIPNDFDTILDSALSPITHGEEFRLLESPHDCSFGLLQPLDETEFLTEGVDDEMSNDCISQNFVYPENPISASKNEQESNIHPQEQDNTEESCLLKMEPDIHYHNVLGSIFKTKHDSFIRQPSVGNKESCFVSWKKWEGLGSYHINPRRGNTQKILKNILFGVTRTHFASTSEHKVDGIQWNPEPDNLVNDKYSSLKSLIPSTVKDDKVSILDDTIKYMKELERRVKELEASQVNLDEEFCVGKKPQDATERTSDNYRIGVKRKADDVGFEGKMEENSLVSLRDSSSNTSISISLIQKDVWIEITCPHNQYVLLEIIDALTNLKLDSHSVQSSISDGILCVTIKAKIKGFGVLSVGMIRQVLQGVLIRSG